MSIDLQSVTVQTAAVLESMASRMGVVRVMLTDCVADGVVDDALAIQAAVSALTAGQTLVFPPGIYRVATNIVKTGVDHLKLTGHGVRIYEGGASLTGLFTFTSCDFLTIEGFDFEATETAAYFQANSPTEERSFIYLNSCEGATIRGVSGRGKRRLATLLSCHRANVDGYEFTGFLPDISEGVAANAKEAACLSFRGCNDSTASNGRVNNHGSAFLSQLTSANLSIRGIVASEMHDTAIYVSSGRTVAIAGCCITNGCTDGIKGRGWGISITGNSVTGMGNSGIVLSGTGAVLDALDAIGSGLVATGNNVTDCNRGISVRDALELFARDIVVSNNVVLNSLETGDTGAIDIASGIGGVVCNGNVVRGAAADNGIVIIDGLAGAGTITGVICCGNFVSGVTGSAASTRGGIRLNWFSKINVSNNTFEAIDCGIGVRLHIGVKGIVANNHYDGGQVVRTNTDGTTADVLITGNKGATLVTDGTYCPLGFNDATVTGFPAVSSTPLRRGLLTIVAGVAYVSVAEASSADWHAIT